MYGLPENIDLSFFLGKDLEQLAFSPGQIQFFFSEGIHIGFSGEFSHSAHAKTSGWDESTPLINAASILSLVGAKVIDVHAVTDGTLTLRFSNSETIVLYDNSEHYESYTIRHGDDVWVI
ncbi:MAG: hypothetical protein K2Q17_09625 [Nitrospiraceae bacterium]|jgi:hypothetical protein|uniref:DUF6188 family protein n=1 Tax=Nitrospira cf. moscoviensis SBR1015 TaxID=96242 RepID=UPI000A0B119A|nr:DUF6188 family protein [Nitrospira cf. moscoviensis SBR1015]MBY0247915.1 hypothetical protein [Nitrospiraceae bacterium]OQW37128.1 MAG: hypothetical protein A4E20_05550 [Nitrospira sp. SG-bin2]